MAASDPEDRIRLSNWSVQVAIGAYEHEKAGTQELVLDLTLTGDFSVAAQSDRLEDALDYAALRADVEDWLVGRRWQLLEAFASALCRKVLEHRLVREVALTVDKPAAQAPLRVSYATAAHK